MNMFPFTHRLILLAVLLFLTACGPCRRPGEREKAIALLEKGLQLEKDSLFTDAVEAYEKAIQADPDFRDAWFQAGNLYDKLGLMKKAQHAYETVLRLNPNDAAAYNNLGNIFGHLGKVDEAIRSYRKAVELNDSLVSAHYNLAQSLLIKQDWASAERSYQKARSLKPTEYRYAEALGVFYLGQKRFPEARRVFFDALSIPDYPPVNWRYLADAYRGNEAYDSALVMMENYIARLNDDQEKRIAHKQIYELKKEKAFFRSSQLRKKLANQSKKD